jgi:hypothetical protein
LFETGIRRLGSKGNGSTDRRREGAAGSAETRTPPRSRESRVTESTKEKQAVKKAIAIKLIKSKTARKVAVKALQNKRVRKIAVDVAKRRVLGK